MEWDVVDLGSKKATAISAFPHVAKSHLSIGPIKPSRCLCVDIGQEFERFATARGYAFQRADVLQFQFPPARHYIAVDFLEHLPTVEDSKAVFSRMLKAASVGVWVRIPSFEDEPQLSSNGLRLTWHSWACHPARIKVADLLTVSDATVKVARFVDHSGQSEVVPIDSDPEARSYSEDLGPKPEVQFDQPIPGHWDFFVRRI